MSDKLWARTAGDGNSTFIAELFRGAMHPWHRATPVVDMTGMDGYARVGSRVTPGGNLLNGAPAMDTLTLARAQLPDELAHQTLRGIWVHDGDDKPAHFDTHHETLAMLAALAAGGAGRTPDSLGELRDVSAHAVLEHAGEFMAACHAHAAGLAKAVDEAEGGAAVDVTDGWPDNGEPDEARGRPRRPVAVAHPQSPFTGASGTAGTGPATNLTGVQPSLGTTATMVADGTNLDGSTGQTVEGTVDGRQAERVAPPQIGDVPGTAAGKGA